jgi:hypothetical protein
MKKYKIIKRQVQKTTWEEVEEKVPMWYFRFLLWLFEREEETLDRIWEDTRAVAWDKGFSLATARAHTYKEEAMQKKLAELGYEVRCNFPMARMNPELSPTTEAVDPIKSWDIIKTN